MKFFKIIVVGGGHSGIEAVNIISKLGEKVLLITDNILNIGKMSCNPSIGGVGKGQLVKEIDVLGGNMGFIADVSGINFKTLNTSKGLAVRSTRVQTDKILYMNNMRILLKSNKNLTIIQDSLYKILLKNNEIYGIETIDGLFFSCKCLIITTGTFLRSSIYIGKSKISKDIENKKTRFYLSDQLNDIQSNCRGRFKTGTPPRIEENTIDFSSLIKQKSDFPCPYFSYIHKTPGFLRNFIVPPKVFCYLTKTNSSTHDFILKNIKLSSRYSGLMNSKGPRYCPSIEDKIFRFPEKECHNIFLEKESHYSKDIYPSGLSNSLPFKEQEGFIRTIKGLENSKITSFGYSIEYDYFNPIFLKRTLESKLLGGLYLAGQINGTTGYEEAASQGLMAGINAVFKLRGYKKFFIKKSEGYIGVLIDDLVKNGVDEPYRMFTSRSAYRLETREDNVEIRFIKKLNILKTISRGHLSFFLKKRNNVLDTIQKFKSLYFEKKNVFNLIRDYKFNKFNFIKFIGKKILDIDLIFSEIKYSNYIKIERDKNFKIRKCNNIFIKENVKFSDLKSLTKETLERLKRFKPKDFNDVKNIRGIRISEVLDIYFFLKKH